MQNFRRRCTFPNVDILHFPFFILYARHPLRTRFSLQRPATPEGRYENWQTRDVLCATQGRILHDPRGIGAEGDEEEPRRGEGNDHRGSPEKDAAGRISERRSRRSYRPLHRKTRTPGEEVQGTDPRTSARKMIDGARALRNIET